MAFTTSTPTYQVGPRSGFRTPGRIKAKDLEITGTLTAGVISAADTLSNTISADVSVGAGFDITAASGDGKLDYALATGIFTSPTGTNTLSGNTVIAAGKSLTAGPIKNRVLSKTANYTVLDTDADIIFCAPASAHMTITLPTAGDNTGRIITVSVNGDPAAYNVIVDGEGSEKINDATTYTNSDEYSYLTVVCDGVGWQVIGKTGTWT